MAYSPLDVNFNDILLRKPGGGAAYFRSLELPRSAMVSMRQDHVDGGVQKWGLPHIIHFRLGFHLVNHPILEVPPIYGNPPIWYH